MLLLDDGGLGALTTNAIARKAGVSIGTLYQYFPDKGAVLDALAEREREALGKRVMAALSDPAPQPPEARALGIIRAVTASYGERRRVHKIIIEHSLASNTKGVSPLVEQVIAMLAHPDLPVPQISEAEAFVRAHAFAGVMRAMLLRDPENALPQSEIEAVLARLMTTL